MRKGPWHKDCRLQIYFLLLCLTPRERWRTRVWVALWGQEQDNKVLPLDKGLSCCTRAALTALTPHSAGGTEVRGISALSSVFHLHTCPRHCCFFSYLSLPSHFILFHCSISSLCAGVKHVLLSHLVVSISLGKLNVVLESLSVLMVCFTQ